VQLMNWVKTKKRERRHKGDKRRPRERSVSEIVRKEDERCGKLVEKREEEEDL